MAHWAEIDENNIVTRVLVGDNNDPNGDEGYKFFIDTFGGRWVKTSYNASIRKNFAGIGSMYDEERDAFISPKPYISWILNEETCRWEPPTKYPEDGGLYLWNDKNLKWESAKID
jgi:hypothetical protein